MQTIYLSLVLVVVTGSIVMGMPAALLSTLNAAGKDAPKRAECLITEEWPLNYSICVSLLTCCQSLPLLLLIYLSFFFYLFVARNSGQYQTERGKWSQFAFAPPCH